MDEDISKTSGKRSKATSPRRSPAARPRTRWRRSFALRARRPPAAVAKAVAAARRIGRFIGEKLSQMRIIFILGVKGIKRVGG